MYAEATLAPLKMPSSGKRITGKNAVTANGNASVTQYVAIIHKA